MCVCIAYNSYRIVATDILTTDSFLAEKKEAAS